MTDVDGNPLTASVVDSPAHGTLIFNSDGSFSYTPNADYNGTDSFTYKVSDGTADSAIQTININITPVNDTPVGADGTVITLEDTAVSGNVVMTDVDGNALTASVVTGPAHGTLILIPTDHSATHLMLITTERIASLTKLMTEPQIVQSKLSTSTSLQ